MRRNASICALVEFSDGLLAVALTPVSIATSVAPN
jgi:hypothetical protein